MTQLTGASGTSVASASDTAPAEHLSWSFVEALRDSSEVVPIQLGLGGTVNPVDDFDWSAQRLAAYERATRADGADGRMVMMGPHGERLGCGTPLTAGKAAGS